MELITEDPATGNSHWNPLFTDLCLNPGGWGGHGVMWPDRWHRHCKRPGKPFCVFCTRAMIDENTLNAEKAAGVPTY